MDELTRQRIKFLIETGEVYPDRCRRRDAIMWWALGALAVLQVVELLVVFLR